MIARLLTHLGRGAWPGGLGKYVSPNRLGMCARRASRQSLPRLGGIIESRAASGVVLEAPPTGPRRRRRVSLQLPSDR
jgi:hypothetical protein